MTARALLVAVLGFALCAAALWFPLAAWALPVTVAGILLLALGAQRLVAAADPPEELPVIEPVPAEFTERTEWPRPPADETTNVLFDPYWKDPNWPYREDAA